MLQFKFRSSRRIVLCAILFLVIAALFLSPAASAADPEPSTLTISQTVDNLDNASESIDSFTFKLELYDKNLITVSGYAWWTTLGPTHPDSIVITLYQNDNIYDTRTVTTYIGERNNYEFVVPEKDPSGTLYTYRISAPFLNDYIRGINGFNVRYILPIRSSPMPEVPASPLSMVSFKNNDNLDSPVMPAAVPSAVAIPVELSPAEITRLQAISSYNFTVVSTGVYTFTLAPGEQLDIALDERCEFIVTQTGAISGNNSVSLDTSRVTVEVDGADDKTETYPVASGALLANTAANAQFNYSFSSSPSPTTPSSVPQTGDSSDISIWALVAASCIIIVLILNRRRAKNM